jgi:hypothetical protein
MNEKFVLYHHKNLSLAKYVVECSPTLLQFRKEKQVSIVSLPQQHAHPTFAELPTDLRKLLFFARPDVVVCLDDGIRPTHPIFAFEQTNHVPARDHWMQRFNHLVGCAQQGVPGAYIMPFSMPNHPKFPSTLDNVFFYAYDRVTEIHRTPMFIAEWEVPDGHTPKCDSEFSASPDRHSPDIRLTFAFLESVITSAIHGRPLSELYKERLIVDVRNKIRVQGYKQLPEIKDFARLAYNMPNNRMMTNAEFKPWLACKGLQLPTDIPDRIEKRNRHLIFVPQSERSGKTVEDLRHQLLERIKLKGGDPYLGQPLAFDYIFCRLGPTPYERDANLVLDLSVLKFEDFAEYHKSVWKLSPLQYTSVSKIGHIPTYTMHLKEGFSQILKNVVRVYAFAADIIVFRDGLIYF